MHLTVESRTKHPVDSALTRMMKRLLKKSEDVLSKRLKSYCPRGVVASDLALNVYLVNDREIKKINREYRGKDSATDVITFSFVETKEFMPVDKASVKKEGFPAGEIFLSIDTIARQAKEQKIPFEQEMCYMLIHGLLHTFGYDHATRKEERIMEEQSFLILGKLYPRKKEFGF